MKVVLDDVAPPVIRVVDVRTDIRLERLHTTLQAALGWMDCHLWEFRAGGAEWGMPDPDWSDGPRDAAATTLRKVLAETGAETLTYLYDFGDGWKHTIDVVRIGDAVSGTEYPVLVEASGRCPPEDVGGPWGYAEFLEAVADPGHERHEEFKEWCRGDFDPLDVPLDGLKSQVGSLAANWTRTPRKRKAK